MPVEELNKLTELLLEIVQSNSEQVREGLTMSELKAVIVQCGNEEYAISVEAVVSIERLEQVNPIPHLPDYMLGLMRIRGELVPILDFEQILYGRSAKEQEDARVVVVQTRVLYIGSARSGCKRNS